MKMLIIDNINHILNLLISRRSLSIEETGRRKLLVVFFLMIIPADIIFGILQFTKGFNDIAIIDFFLVLIMTSFVIMLRYIKNTRPLYRVILFLYSITLIYFIQTGIVQGYASIWAMFHPLFAFFLLGKKEGAAWTFVFTVVMISIFINPYSSLSGFTYSSQFTSRFLPTFFMICIFTYSYENVREKYKYAMEAEQVKLLLEKEKFAEANRHLEEEMRMKELAEVELRRHRDHLEDIIAERTLEIKKNSEELEANEKRYRLMADNINDMIWTTDMGLKFSFISSSVTRIYGYTVDEAMNLPHDKWNTPESYSKILKAYQEQMEIEKKGNQDPGNYIILQLEQVKKDGTIFPVELKVSIIRDENRNAIGIVGITRDISDRIIIEHEKEKINEQLSQSQKMEAIGTLVGGLAHDFNNFLAGIIGSFDLISLALKKEKLEKREYIEKHINIGIGSSKRSAGLINQLLVLSRKHEIKLSPLDIKNSINNIYELCRNSFPKSIKLDFNTEESPLIITGDMVQIEQVLLNLCINASHAMTIMRPTGEKQGGTLTVTAGKVESDYIMKKNHPAETGSVDHWVMIKIADTGVGIDHDLQQRIFEPFFSTKSFNESTGLGLAISYNIIKRHGGLINVYSEPGSGTCFSIYFPVLNNSNNIIPGDAASEIIRGIGTILIIDDEPVILYIAEGFLKECGYTVITAEGADMGIEIFNKKHSEISAVIIDLSMPGRTGLEVFQELKKTDPDVKAVLSSGMLDGDIKDKALEMGVKETINKPYMASELSIIISKVLHLS